MMYTPHVTLQTVHDPSQWCVLWYTCLCLLFARWDCWIPALRGQHILL